MMKSFWSKALCIAAWLVIWHIVSVAAHNPWLIAGPVDTLIAWADLAGSTAFWLSVAHSLGSIALGFVVAFAGGLIMGYAAAQLDGLRMFLKPAITVVKSAPVVCIIVLLLVCTGAQATTSIVVALVVFPQFYHAIIEAMMSRDERFDEVLDVFGVPRMRRVLCVEAVAFGSTVRAALAVAVGLAWKSGVAAELIGLPAASIGEGVYLAKISLESASIIAWTATVILLSWATEVLLLAFTERVLQAPHRWLIARVRRALALGEPSQLLCEAFEHIAPASVSIVGVTRTFQNEEACEGIVYRDRAMPAGRRFCVMAPSGGGKTTLLRMIARIDVPDSGAIDHAPCGQSVSVMLQEDMLLRWATAAENIALVACDDAEMQRGNAYLRRLFDEADLSKAVRDLSGGMRRRAELCRALAHPASLVILDEPFSGLDEQTKLRCIRLIDEALCGRTLIFATHDEADAVALGAEVLHL